MAIYYLRVETISRKKSRSSVAASAYRSGRSVVAAAAYRSGERIQNNYDGLTHDYTFKRGVVYSEILLPENAPQDFLDRSTLWNAAESAEKRSDARTAREVVIALPNELNRDEQIELAKAYAQDTYVSAGMCVDIAIHDGRHRHRQDETQIDGGMDSNIKPENPHAHLLLTDRPVDENGFLPNKDRSWNARQNVTMWRKSWADFQNDKFKELELDILLSHESYKKQGIDREAYFHMGPDASALERKGVQTEIGDKNRAIKARNEERDRLNLLLEKQCEELEQQKELEKNKVQPEQEQDVEQRPLGEKLIHEIDPDDLPDWRIAKRRREQEQIENQAARGKAYEELLRIREHFGERTRGEVAGEFGDRVGQTEYQSHDKVAEEIARVRDSFVISDENMNMIANGIKKTPDRPGKIKITLKKSGRSIKTEPKRSRYWKFRKKPSIDGGRSKVMLESALKENQAGRNKAKRHIQQIKVQAEIDRIKEEGKRKMDDSIAAKKQEQAQNKNKVQTEIERIKKDAQEKKSKDLHAASVERENFSKAQVEIKRIQTEARKRRKQGSHDGAKAMQPELNKAQAEIARIKEEARQREEQKKREREERKQEREERDREIAARSRD